MKNARKIDPLKTDVLDYTVILKKLAKLLLVCEYFDTMDDRHSWKEITYQNTVCGRAAATMPGLAWYGQSRDEIIAKLRNARVK